MDQRARRQAGQDAVQQDVDVAAGHQDVAGIDEQHVALHQSVEDGVRCCLQGRRLHADPGQVGNIGARRRIDRQDFADTAHGLGQQAGRRAGSHFDDATRLALADQRIGNGGVERGKPRLLEHRLAALAGVGARVDGIEHGGELGGMRLEQALDRGIGRLRAGRRQQRRIAVRNEPAARLEAEHGRQSQGEAPPAAAQGGPGTHRGLLTGSASGLRGRPAHVAGHSPRCPVAPGRLHGPRRP